MFKSENYENIEYAKSFDGLKNQIEIIERKN